MDMFDRNLRKYIWILNIIGAVFLIVVMMVIVVNVILRPIRGGIIGSMEMVELFMVPMVSFALGYTAVKKAHIVVDILTSYLSKKKQVILSIITGFFSLSILSVMFWLVMRFSWSKWISGEATILLNWQIGPFRFIVVLGLAILCLVIFMDLYNSIREAIKK